MDVVMLKWWCSKFGLLKQYLKHVNIRLNISYIIIVWGDITLMTILWDTNNFLNSQLSEYKERMAHINIVCVCCHNGLKHVSLFKNNLFKTCTDNGLYVFRYNKIKTQKTYNFFFFLINV